MSRYAHLLMEFSRQSRPRALAEIADPETFFGQAAQQIAADVNGLRREMLGPQRPGETDAEHQIRSSQALAAAEELILSDHWLLQPEPTPEEDLRQDDDPTVAAYYRDLKAIEMVKHQDW